MISNIKKIAKKIRSVSLQKLNEEQTKTALVLPFISALGYDVFNPAEIVPEFCSDIGTKKGERVDYALMRDSGPSVLIECKPFGARLDAGKCSQLRRYFQSHLSVRVGILTDGNAYLLFSDFNNKNIMDDDPFLSFCLDDFNEFALPQIVALSKNKWNPNALLKSGEYEHKFKAILKSINECMADLPDDFVQYLTARSLNEVKVTKANRKYYASIISDAIDSYTQDIFTSYMHRSGIKAKGINSLSMTQQQDIETVNTEVWGMLIIRALLSEYINPLRIWMEDTKKYCSITLDDNPEREICRFHNFEEWHIGGEHIGEKAMVTIFSTTKGEKHHIRFVDDLYPLKQKLVEAVSRIDGS